MEAGTEQKPPAKKWLTVFGQAARRKRVFARLREGWAYDEIAREKQLKISELLQRREIDDAHALPQLCRLAPALRVAGEPVADVSAITPLMKAPGRLDRDRAAHRPLASCARPAIHPEIAPQAIENARFAPGNAMASTASGPQNMAARRVSFASRGAFLGVHEKRSSSAARGSCNPPRNGAANC